MKRKLDVVDFIEHPKVQYYSLQFEDENESLTLNFFDEFKNSIHKESLQLIMTWIQILGTRQTAAKRILRDEAVNKEEKYSSAIAYPPKTQYVKAEREKGLFDTDNINDELTLRLYGLWVDESIIILLSGCEKLADLAQKCENCRPHFFRANNFSRQLHQQASIIEKEPKRIKNKKDLNFEQN